MEITGDIENVDILEDGFNKEEETISYKVLSYEEHGVFIQLGGFQISLEDMQKVLDDMEYCHKRTTG